MQILFSCQASDYYWLGIPTPTNWCNRHTDHFPTYAVCTMVAPSFGNMVTILLIILLNCFREFSILPFSPPVLFFQVMIARVKHPSLSKTILGKRGNETEFWQKPFRVKFRGNTPSISRHV